MSTNTTKGEFYKIAVKHISVRIDDKTLNKLHVVSDYEGRSASSQVLMLIRKMIQEFEQEHGEIKFGKSDPSL